MSFSGFIKRNIFWVKDFFAGRKVAKHFHHIKRGMNDYEKGKERQLKDLSRLLDYATSYSNFYKNIKIEKGKECCLSDFPIVNKNILNNNHDQVAVEYQYIPEQETEKNTYSKD